MTNFKEVFNQTILIEFLNSNTVFKEVFKHSILPNCWNTIYQVLNCSNVLVIDQLLRQELKIKLNTLLKLFKVFFKTNNKFKHLFIIWMHIELNLYSFAKGNRNSKLKHYLLIFLNHSFDLLSIFVGNKY